MTLSRVCTKCWQEKELDEFYTDKSSKDGHTATCRNCIREYQNRSWNQKRRKVMATVGLVSQLGIMCSECETWYDRADVFEIHPVTGRGEFYKEKFSHAKLYSHILANKGQAKVDFRLVCRNCATIMRTTPSQQESQEPFGQ